MDFVLDVIEDFMAFILERTFETGTTKSKKVLTVLRF